MKKILIFSFLLWIQMPTNALQANQKEAKTIGYKIVFQLTTNDSLSHKALMKQLGNITSVSPQTKIAVVCHGPGLEMLIDGKSVVKDKIPLFANKGIEFIACEFSLKERKINKSSILPLVTYTEAGIIEIVARQDNGWYYIKSGF